MNFNSVVSRLATTRARIESQLHGPSVIAITSGLPTDGAELLARGLAMSFAAVQASVLLVDAAERVEPNRAVSLYGEREQLKDVREGAAGTPDFLRLKNTGSFSRGDLAVMLQEFKTKYSVIVIETAPVGSSALALNALSVVDGVVIAFRTGRAARKADAELMTQIESVRAKILGVVMVEPACIRSYDAVRLDLATTRSGFLREPKSTALEISVS